jgi:hypothetical protein
MDAEPVLIVVAMILVVGVVYQIIITRKQQSLVNDLNQRIRQLDTQINQPLQRLQRARELMLKVHETEVILFFYNTFEGESSPESIRRFAEFTAYMAELRGLAFVINDREFLEIVNRPYPLESEEIQGLDPTGKFERMEALSRRRSQALHKRIYQLMEDMTNK